MKFVAASLSFAAAACLAGCSKPAPRATTYFAGHLDEARQVAAECRNGSARGDECTNAETAIQEAEAKERFKRFRGD